MATGKEENPCPGIVLFVGSSICYLFIPSFIPPEMTPNMMNTMKCALRVKNLEWLQPDPRGSAAGEPPPGSPFCNRPQRPQPER